MDVLSYYRNSHVRERMIEFMGGKSLDSSTCMFITQCDCESDIGWDLKRPTELDFYWSQWLDVSRSLWDKKWLIAHLDIEYVNFDFPAEPYLDPERSFSMQRPSVLAIEEFLLGTGIAPLHVLSGRGHHFVWNIDRDSAAFGKLAELGHLPLHLEKRYAEMLPPVNIPIERDLGAAFAGLALVMEYVAIMIKDKAELKSLLPVELSAVEVSPQFRGREMISIDITEYCDLLNTRLVRIPYSVYLKPWHKIGDLDDQIKKRIPPMVSVPLFEMDINEGIAAMRDLSKAAELASRASVQIPDQSKQMLDLIRSYETSEIARVHNWFYSEEQ